MPAECIHGLDEGLCDVCSPQKRPEPAPAPPKTRARTSQPLKSSVSTNADGTAVRSSAARASTPRPSRAAAAGVPRTVTIDLSAQRMYHVTHIDNLESIVAAGRLDADAALTERPAVDLSAEITREHRRSVDVAAGHSVADFVPFYLTPHASLWADLRTGAAGPHWSADARAAIPADFVLLVASLQKASVVSDGDASHALTRFSIGPDAFARTIVRLQGDELSLAGAEALVAGSLPLDAIATVGVSTMSIRNRVRALFAGSAFAPKVAVYPPWFQAAPIEEE